MTKKNAFLNKTFQEFRTAITHFRRRHVCLLPGTRNMVVTFERGAPIKENVTTAQLYGFS